MDWSFQIFSDERAEVSSGMLLRGDKAFAHSYCRERVVSVQMKMDGFMWTKMVSVNLKKGLYIYIYIMCVSVCVCPNTHITFTFYFLIISPVGGVE
tara:strand:+ start:960 stop:1247 length:288 start_codon:yes stop_codon:yes gene_type:complete